MDGQDIPIKDSFIQAAEVWVPEGDTLVFAAGDYGDMAGFAAASKETSFARGAGLPGKAWAEGRPVVLKAFDGSYFKRTDAAKEAGLTAAVAIPVFSEDTLLAVLVILCGDTPERVGAIEIWTEDNGGMLKLDDGYYGAAQEFEFVSQHTHFPRGQGLPGAVWASNTPMFLRDLGSAYRFIRASAAGAAGLTVGLGLPIPCPGTAPYILTLLSALGTPLARRFEIWDTRKAGTAVLVDGICEVEGPLWVDDGSGANPDRPVAAKWKGPVGQILGNGQPHVAASKGGLPAAYTRFVGLPIYADGSTMTHIVAWYS